MLCGSCCSCIAAALLKRRWRCVVSIRSWGLMRKWCGREPCCMISVSYAVMLPAYIALVRNLTSNTVP